MYDLTFWTYIITNACKGTLYIGHTDNIRTRMEQHINGKFEGFSKHYGLKHLVWRWEFASCDEAFQEERRLKNWRRDWKIELIEESNPMWIDIYQAPTWLLPDAELFPELHEAVLQHRLGPGVRRDERRYIET